MKPLLGCLGLSHHTAPLKVREALCLSPAAQTRLFERAREVEGLALLFTCNRLEFYVERKTADTRPLSAIAHALLPCSHGSFLSTARSYVHEYSGLGAVHHLARVAAGLDSMVLGEPQIQGQVQESLRQSEAHQMASPLLRAMFHAALKAGGRVRQETALARNAVSVASLAVALLKRQRGPLARQRIAIIGAGSMGRLVAKICHRGGAAHIAVINRTLARAEEVADPIGAAAYPLTDLPAVLAHADAVFCTALGSGVLMEESHLARRTGPLFIVDLAVPRNVAGTVAAISSVQLYDIDSLREGVDASLAQRRAEVPKAEAIVEAAVSAFDAHLRTQAVEPLIRNLRRKAEAIRQAELDRALAGMNGLSSDDREHLQRFSHALVRKLLHEPTTRLRQRAATRNAAQESEIIRSLFAL